MQPAQSLDITKLKDVAEQAALQAGELLRRKWSQPRQISQKGYRDVVTDADYASQALITSLILANFPDHGFLNEEDDPSLPEAGPVIWVIDPVDGTTNYSRHIPAYSIAISAAVKQESSQTGGAFYQPVVGVVYDPMRDEIFSAASGGHSTLNGDEINVSKVSELSEAVISLDWSRDYERRQVMLSALNRFAHQVRTVRVSGSAALSLAWVAAGRLDVYFNFGIGPWDVAAAAVIINQAGGQVTNPDGEPWSLGDANCFASNTLIHLPFMAQAGIHAGK